MSGCLFVKDMESQILSKKSPMFYISKEYLKKEKAAKNVTDVSIVEEVHELGFFFKRGREEEENEEDTDLTSTFQVPIIKQELDNTSSYMNIGSFQQEIISMCMRESKPENLLFSALAHCIEEKRDDSDTKSVKPEDKKRKFSTDSLHKRLKRLFVTFLQKQFVRLFSYEAPKVPKASVSNVTIQYNKTFLNYNVGEFYFNMCNTEINNPFRDEEKASFLNCKIKDLYQLYSKNFLDHDLKKLKEKESEPYCEKLKKKSLAFLDYYTYLKPFQKKIKIR